MQKNGEHGEVIGLALACRVFHLTQHNAAPNTSLCAYYSQENHWLAYVCPSQITNTSRQMLLLLVPPLVSFLLMLVHAACEPLVQMLCCVQMSIKMLFIFLVIVDQMKCFDTYTFRNLNTLRHFSQHMLIGGNFTLIPNQEVPLFKPSLPSMVLVAGKMSLKFIFPWQNGWGFLVNINFCQCSYDLAYRHYKRK